MHRGDRGGNGQYLNVDPYFDDLLLHGRAASAFMSVEQIVDDRGVRVATGRRSRMRINRLMTDGVVETPHGAHFTECVPDYRRDEAFQQEYAASAKTRRRVGRVAGEVPRLRRPRRVPEGGRAVSDVERTADPRRGTARSRVAECFRGDGEILANPIGTIPTIGGRLAKATFEPDLVMTDGEALLVENILPVGVDRRREGRRRRGTRTARCSTSCGRVGAT